VVVLKPSLRSVQNDVELPMNPFGDEPENTGDDLYEAVVWLHEHLGFPRENPPADDDDEHTLDG
jgi:hypothetical protein